MLALLTTSTSLTEELAALCLGVVLLGVLPAGRPGSLRAGERAATLGQGFALGLLPATAGLSAFWMGALALGILAWPKLFGPASMIPGRSIERKTEPIERALVLGAALAAVVLRPMGVPGALHALAALLVVAEALRAAGRSNPSSWALLITLPILFAGPSATWPLAAAFAAGVSALRRADRRQLSLTFLALALLGWQGFPVPALVLGTIYVVLLPAAFRPDAAPWALVLLALQVPFLLDLTNPFGDLTLPAIFVPGDTLVVGAVLLAVYWKSWGGARTPHELWPLALFAVATIFSFGAPALGVAALALLLVCLRYTAASQVVG